MNTSIVHQTMASLTVIPENIIAVSVYVAGAILVLLLWYLMTRPYPKFCAMSTWIVFAFMVTPSISDGSNAAIAPAVFGLMFGIVTHDHNLMWVNLATILFVIGLGSVVGFFWLKFLQYKSQQTKNTAPL
ncbi:hypothetical protein [Acinetobacter brisouii]|uniref:Uncharacterized protein n=1 Tax=Acinetobacter brisouii CIP 110357 TaxID=1341683 RepID=V2VY73_9GAMM|nr:hypothetical protein [Acinetobacter brisouii]ENV46711.1 hypothetical protein F954_02700 [Acinetobacter brisouii ANC 4119]ESK52699.1 hypothetical protein P255_00860 [Acinetobacter brisouii CIP 110357]KJV39152.1 membrane protein [Acinetobacter brisouii]